MPQIKQNTSFINLTGEEIKVCSEDFSTLERIVPDSALPAAAIVNINDALGNALLHGSKIYVECASGEIVRDLTMVINLPAETTDPQSDVVYIVNREVYDFCKRRDLITPRFSLDGDVLRCIGFIARSEFTSYRFLI